MNNAEIEPETFYQLKDFLEEYIDPDYGLLDKLQFSNALTAKEIRLIKNQLTFDQRNTKLLEYVAEKNKYNSLTNALKETQQEHVINYLNGKREYSPTFGDEWPLREEELSILNTNHEALIEIISPDEIVGLLYSQDVINKRQSDAINSKPTCHEKNEYLLEILRRGSLKKFKDTIKCLRQSNQSHVANVLEYGGEYCPKYGDEWPLREAELSILKTNQEVLIEIINSDELVGILYSKNVISKRQLDVINSKPTCHEKNESFLEILRRRSLKDFKVTIKCLRESNQTHIAEVLEKGGAVIRVHVKGLDDTTEDEVIDSFTNVLRNRPIEESVRILEGTLIALKKGKSVVLYIYCRTIEQLMQLKETQTNDQLKKAIQRLFTKLLTPEHNTKVTVQNFHNIVESMFIQLLHRSKIDEIALSLSMKEYDRCRYYFSENIKIRAVHNFNPFDMESTEMNEFENFLHLKSCNLKEPKDESERNQLNLDATLQTPNSETSDKNGRVRLNIFEETLRFKKGDVMDTFPPINIGDISKWWRAIHLESGKVGYVPRKLVIIDYQMHFDQKYETSAATRQREYLKSATSNTSMCNLPLELLDSILQKSYLQHVLREEHVLKNKDYHTISQMALVDFCWFERIRNRKFKKQLRRSLIVFYRRNEKLSSIYRINRQYLEENIQLKGVLNQLKSNDCLTDDQTASLYRQNLPLFKEKSFKRFRDLTSEVVKKKETIHSVLRRSLCDTKQHLIAEVIENGGVTTKVEIKIRKVKSSNKTPSQHLQIVERMNEIRGRTKARSHQIEELMGKLKQDDLEILSASPDGDVIVVWIWCKTTYALEKLQALNNSNDLTDVFTEVIKNLSFLSEEQNLAIIKPRVCIDFEQFEKTVVFFSIVANFTSRLYLRQRSESAWGVTKLRKKIHVLIDRYPSTPHCAIVVFDDQIPFRLQKRIEISEIENPKDIVSNEVENSLYVLDFSSKNRYIWKIKEGHDKEKTEKIIRWMELGDNYAAVPGTPSLTSDGKLLSVSWEKDDSVWVLRSLRIFGGKVGAEKADHLSITLPEDIQRRQHLIQAKETSKGNFIIPHEIKRRKEQKSGTDGGRRQIEEEMEEMEMMWVVSEVSGDGKTIVRQFIPRNEEQKLGACQTFPSFFSGRLAFDSLDRVFLPDFWKDRVILLDSDLQWKGILIPTTEDGREGRRIREPSVLYYDKETKQIIVDGKNEIFVYTLNRK